MDKNMKIAVCDSDKDFLNKVEVILQKLSKNNGQLSKVFNLKFN